MKALVRHALNSRLFARLHAWAFRDLRADEMRKFASYYVENFKVPRA